MSGFTWGAPATNQNSSSINNSTGTPASSGSGGFGQPTQNATPAANPFGTPQPGGGGLFGSLTSAAPSAFGGGTGTPSGGGGVFGSSNTGAATPSAFGGTSTTTGPSLFGSSTTNASSGPPTTGLGFGSGTTQGTTGFGQAASGASGGTASGTTLGGGGIFGAKPSGTTLGGGGFFGGGASTPTKPADSGTTGTTPGLRLGGGGFFGVSTTTTTPSANTSTSLFGNPPTSSPTPAAAASSVPSLFSWNKPAETQNQNPAANAAPGTPGPTLGSTTGGTGFGLFGQAQVASSPTPTGAGGGFSFGAVPKPADVTTPSAEKPAAPTGGLFGTSSPSLGAGSTLGGGGLFGSKSAGTAAPSLFGAAPTTQPASSTALSNTLFGQPAAKPGGLFGSAPAATNTTGSGTSTQNLFGAPSASTTSGAPASTPAPNLSGSAQPASNTGVGFGSAQPAVNTGGGLFGGQPQKPGGLFGAAATSTPTTNLGAAGSQQLDASKTGLNALGQPAAASKPGTPVGGGLGGFSWGKPAPPPTTGSPAPSTPTGTTPAPSTQPVDKNTPSTTGETPAPPSLLSFGASKPAPSLTTPGTGLLGATTTAKPGEAPTMVPSTLGTGGLGSTSTAAAPTPATASVPLASAAPSVLKGKSLEEIINKWATELDGHARDFSNMASEIAHWDRELGENGNQISHLQAKLIEAEATQTAIDSNLDHVEQQQRELAAALDTYEKQAREILETGSTGSMRVFDMGPADAERDRSYALAADLNVQLDNLSKSLTQMIESVNSLTAPTQASAASINGSTSPDVDGQGSEDPLTQIAAVLNAHLKSLQWIDATVHEVEAKVDEAETKVREAAGGGRGGAHNAGRSAGGGTGMRESSSGGSGGVPLSAFGSMSLRGSEPPRPRGFGLGSSTYRG